MRSTRFTAATVAIVALLASAFAIPASAQEGWENLQACATAISEYLESQVAEEDRADTFLLLNGETISVSELLAELADVSELDRDGELADWIVANCNIYITETLPQFFERPPEAPVTPDDEEPEVAGVSLTRPAEVLGVSLPITGTDAVILALFGALLLGLGVLAVRRTRPKASGLR